MKPSDDFSLYQKIWDFTREQLSVKYPFFRKLLWNFSFKESEDTETAGTDGRNIYFNPDFDNKKLPGIIHETGGAFSAHAVSLPVPSSHHGCATGSQTLGSRL